MQNGISVWLDVPLDALAQRIIAVGTDSRPLLHHGSGDPYSKVSFLLYIVLTAYKQPELLVCSFHYLCSFSRLGFLV